MLMKIARILLLIFIIAAGVIEIASLRRSHARLQQRVSELLQRNERIARSREENLRTQSLIARAQAGDADAARMVHSQLMQARLEVAKLERNAEEWHEKRTAQAAALTDALANNRDPEKEMVRIENFQNVGRATPSMAFQTLVWAAVKGDDDTVASILSVTGAAREKAQALIASLPEDMRAKYPTPENLAALVLADAVLDQTAVQVLGQTAIDPLNMTLSINGLEGGSKNVKFLLSASGWQMVIPQGAIGALQNKLNGSSVQAPAK